MARFKRVRPMVGTLRVPRGQVSPRELLLCGAGDSHVGKVRTSNEDVLLLEPTLGLYAVLDGMGGASAGEVAARLACEVIRDVVKHNRTRLPPRELLGAAITAASAAVLSDAQRHHARHGMGTTVVACLVAAQGVVVAHVGDSRAYLWRDGQLQSLTRDHTVVQDLVDRGVMSAASAARHPYRSVLSRNLGSRSEPCVDSRELDLRPGDRLLLCSDGLYSYAAVDAIQYLLGSGRTLKDTAHDLIDLALHGGGGDNVSVVVIESSRS